MITSDRLPSFIVNMEKREEFNRAVLDFLSHLGAH
jgi:hypothetical protein